MMARCKKMMPNRYGWAHQLQCERTATKGDYCWQHDPEYVRRQREKRKTEFAARQAERQRFRMARAVRRIDEWVGAHKESPDWMWSVIRDEILKENE